MWCKLTFLSTLTNFKTPCKTSLQNPICHAIKCDNLTSCITQYLVNAFHMTPNLNSLLAGSVWHDAQKPQSIHGWGVSRWFGLLNTCCNCEHTADVWFVEEEEGHSSQVNNEIWTSETAVINIAFFHHWSHSTGCVYYSLAHYSCWQQRIVMRIDWVCSILTLTPADQFNLSHSRHDKVICFVGKVLLCVKLPLMFPIPVHTNTLTHPPPPVLNRLCLFSMGTSGSLRPRAWQRRCAAVPHV